MVPDRDFFWFGVNSTFAMKSCPSYRTHCSDSCRVTIQDIDKMMNKCLATLLVDKEELREANLIDYIDQSRMKG